MPSSVFRRVADIWKNLPWANSLKMIFESRWRGKCSGGVPFCLGPDFNNNQASLSHTLSSLGALLFSFFCIALPALIKNLNWKGVAREVLYTEATRSPRGIEETGQMKRTVVSTYVEKKKVHQCCRRILKISIQDISGIL